MARGRVERPSAPQRVNDGPRVCRVPEYASTGHHSPLQNVVYYGRIGSCVGVNEPA